MRGPALATAVLFTGLTSFALLRPTPSPAPAQVATGRERGTHPEAARQESLTPLWTALRELRAEVASLQDEAGSPAPEAAAPPTPAEIESTESTYLSRLESSQQEEEEDPEWAQETEAAAEAWFRQDGVMAELLEVDCRSRTCRATFEAASMEARAALFDALPMAAPFNTAGHFSADPAEPLVVELWFSRPGADLPAPS